MYACIHTCIHVTLVRIVLGSVHLWHASLLICDKTHSACATWLISHVWRDSCLMQSMACRVMSRQCSRRWGARMAILLCHISGVLQCAALCCRCCRVLQGVAAWGRTHGHLAVPHLRCDAVCCIVLQCVAVCCRVLQRIAVSRSVGEHACQLCSSARQKQKMPQVCCSVLQCVAVCPNVLQYVATLESLASGHFCRTLLRGFVAGLCCRDLLQVSFVALQKRPATCGTYRVCLGTHLFFFFFGKHVVRPSFYKYVQTTKKTWQRYQKLPIHMLLCTSEVRNFCTYVYISYEEI